MFAKHNVIRHKACVKVCKMISIYRLEAGLLNTMHIIYNLASMHVNNTIYIMGIR